MDRLAIGQMRPRRRPDPVRTSRLTPGPPAQLPRGTATRTVRDMFRRHRTTPDRERELAVAAFRERLAGSGPLAATDRPHIDPRLLRARLGGGSTGLRERLGRGFSAT